MPDKPCRSIVIVGIAQLCRRMNVQGMSSIERVQEDITAEIA
jgi:hypothetical protein